MKHTNIITYQQNNRKSYLPHTDKLPKVAVDFIWDDLLKDEDDKVKSLFSILRKEHELNTNIVPTLYNYPWINLEM